MHQKGAAGKRWRQRERGKTRSTHARESGTPGPRRGRRPRQGCSSACSHPGRTAGRRREVGAELGVARRRAARVQAGNETRRSHRAGATHEIQPLQARQTGEVPISEARELVTALQGKGAGPEGWVGRQTVGARPRAVCGAWQDLASFCAQRGRAARTRCSCCRLARGGNAAAGTPES